MPDESTRLRMRTAHSHQGYRCSCGKEVSGNGGMTSHRKACDGYYLTWGDAYEARRARLSDTPAAPTTPEARILLMKRLNAILDDRWPLTGKIMAAVDEYAAARFTPAEALPLRAALERLLAVAMTEEEDVSAATQDEWIAAIKQANEALTDD